jgi:hypothetical protein
MSLILLLLQPMVFFQDIYLFLQLRWIGLFGKKLAFVHLETSDLKDDFFQKLTQFSQWNNVLDYTASNTYVFLSRDTGFSSTMLVGLLGRRTAYLHLEKPKLQEVFLFKN